MKDYVKSKEYLTFLIGYSERWKDIQQYFLKMQELTVEQTENQSKDNETIALKLQRIRQEYSRVNYYIYHNFENIELPEDSRTDFFLWFETLQNLNQVLH